MERQFTTMKIKLHNSIPYLNNINLFVLKKSDKLILGIGIFGKHLLYFYVENKTYVLQWIFETSKKEFI